MVPAASIVCMGISCAVSFLLPVVLFVYFRRHMKADIRAFFIGCLVMMMFAFGLEQLFHAAVLGSPAGAAIQGNLWLYALYGGLAAGIFEETGRLAAFSTLLKGRKDADALMYGAGHGGIEAILIAGLSMISNISSSLAINAGRMEELLVPFEGAAADQMRLALETLMTHPSWEFLLAGVERISAVVLHLCLSVLVWFAVKEKKYGFYLAAIAMHAAVDGVTVVLSRMGVPALLLEVLLVAVVAGFAWYMRQFWKAHADVSPEEADA